jgi:hypothetical protein
MEAAVVCRDVNITTVLCRALQRLRDLTLQFEEAIEAASRRSRVSGLEPSGAEPNPYQIPTALVVVPQLIEFIEAGVTTVLENLSQLTLRALACPAALALGLVPTASGQVTYLGSSAANALGSPRLVGRGIADGRSALSASRPPPSGGTSTARSARAAAARGARGMTPGRNVAPMAAVAAARATTIAQTKRVPGVAKPQMANPAAAAAFPLRFDAEAEAFLLHECARR